MFNTARACSCAGGDYDRFELHGLSSIGAASDDGIFYDGFIDDWQGAV